MQAPTSPYFTRILRMHHTLLPDRPNLHAHFSNAAEPVLWVESGDSVDVSVPDVGWGLEPPTSTTAPRKKVEPRDPAKDNGPCLLGPIGVRGAKPGHVLEIRIEHIRTSPWGWSYAGKNMATPALNKAWGVSNEALTLLRWAIDHEQGTATTHDAGAKPITVPIGPFFGTIGVAPNESHAIGWTPRTCGGNMDCRELHAGTTLFLPIGVAGALLSLGDTHATQGGGEVSGTAIECACESARLTLILRTDHSIRTPIAHTPEGIVAIGVGDTLDEAAEQAVGAILDEMTRELSISRAHALALASSVVDIRITQMVNPRRNVHAVWKR